MKILRTTLLLSWAGLVACSSAPNPQLDCSTGLCDEELDPREQGLGDLCEQRRADAFVPEQHSFTPTSLRWSCRDVPDIPDELKGQEYCESFAIVELPVTGTSIALGQQVDENGEAPAAWSEQYTTLSDDDWIALDDRAWEDPMAEAGACIFTSWHSDLDVPVPVCETEEECASYLGLGLNRQNFRMRNAVNSLDAAANLVFDCLQTFAGVTGFDGKPVEDPFTRGCLLNQLINRTSYRKSDTTVCTAALRATECNCWLKDSERDFPDALGALDRRGFHLASWENRKEAPTGCHYVETGDVLPEGSPEEHYIVACPLTVDEVLDHAETYTGQIDLKSYCDEKYGDDVVVHILMNPLGIACTPEESASPHAGSCPTSARRLLDFEE